MEVQYLEITCGDWFLQVHHLELQSERKIGNGKPVNGNLLGGLAPPEGSETGFLTMGDQSLEITWGSWSLQVLIDEDTK